MYHVSCIMLYREVEGLGHSYHPPGSPIGRNLNDGDSIVLLIRPSGSADTAVSGTCRYAISLQ